VTVDQAIALLAGVAGLIGVTVWPALILIIVLRFRVAISDFLGNLGEFTFKGVGIEATARRGQVEAAAALGAAEASRTGAADDGERADTRDVIRSLAESLPDARTQRRLQGSLVLWVDDRPDNNRFERQALEALGVRISLSPSTDDALKRLRERRYDLIVSDMGRPPDARAGYTLLDSLRGTGDRTPFVIYAGSAAPEHVQEALRRGALRCTNSPRELISIVTNALSSDASGLARP